MKFLLTLLTILPGSIIFGQGQTKRILFLGNSYTYVNNLPQLLADVADSMGDSVIFDSNTPGGYTLEQHSYNPTTLEKIAEGNWDFVVLQEQSQLPSFPIEQVEADVFPYAYFLDSTINADNSCAETVFYMTWGRREGDADNCVWWPPVCTYEGMDSLLNLRYRMMADNNNAILSPVGQTWHYLRDHFPSMQLYNADGSHPSPYGTYAAACTFYSVIFRRDPSLITFDFGLTPEDAEAIRNAAKITAFDSLLTWHAGEYDPVADFVATQSADNEITFTNQSLNAATYDWDFGDGSTSEEADPVHFYEEIGNYTVTLIANKCSSGDTSIATVDVLSTLFVTDTQFEFELYPNPASSLIRIEIQTNEQLNYRILTLTGSELQSGSINGSAELDISFIPGGMYILELTLNSRVAGRGKILIAGK